MGGGGGTRKHGHLLLESKRYLEITFREQEKIYQFSSLEEYFIGMHFLSDPYQATFLLFLGSLSVSYHVVESGPSTGVNFVLYHHHCMGYENDSSGEVQFCGEH